MTFEDILVAIEEPIGIITFNRPNVLNALANSASERSLRWRSSRWNGTSACARSS